MVEDPRRAVSLRSLAAFLPEAVVTGAASSAEALALMASRRWDLIVSDEFLPDGDGIEVLWHASQQQPGAARVLMSREPRFDRILLAINHAHVSFVVAKPSALPRLLEFMRNLPLAEAPLTPRQTC